MSIRIRADQVPALLLRIEREVRAAIGRGILAGAERGRRVLVARTPEDQGLMQKSWEVLPQPGGGAVLRNDAPYAGVVEAGARPHPVSREGVENIRGWVERKLGLADREAESATWGIVNKLRRVGQKPTYFVRKSLPELGAAMAREVRLSVEDALKVGGP